MNDARFGHTLHLNPRITTLFSFVSPVCGCQASGYKIAIWTKASKEWADVVLQSAFPGRAWSFVWSGERCTQESVNGMVVKGAKKLSKVWGSTSLQEEGWTTASTLIVEDPPANCRHNWGNSILVTTFDTSSRSAPTEDRELSDLCTYIDTVVADCRAKGGSLRMLDKRAAGW